MRKGTPLKSLPKLKIRIARKYYKPLYSQHIKKLDEMDKSIERHKLPKLTQEEKKSEEIYI